MDTLNPIFLDLAIILITASVTTVLFKWLKQPVVLGYIIAGFFIGPYFPWFPAVTNEANVHVWSDVGVVFLMFAVGLDFSVKKMKKVGATGVTIALCELCVMFFVGNMVGRILGWPTMDCIFLGSMLCVSSTSIVIKSFDDLKLRQQKFTSTVTAGFVVDDLVGVLLLVVLSTLCVSKQFDGAELGFSLVKLVFCLLVWFIFGIYFIPTLLRWIRKYITEETLCIISVGLCFLMVVLAGYAGFSTALGAFLMGSILSETIEADAIHRIITPIKDLFSAVFFVSVGMLVDPAVLVKYIVPILVISLAVLIFKPLATSLGVLLSGKPFKTAVQSGVCFSQVGEFSFIMAALGVSYGAINDALYPVIVSVSILTTFISPYMIKAGMPLYNWLAPRMPKKLMEAIDNYSHRARSTTDEISIKYFLRKQFTSMLIYSAILGALCLISFVWLKPLLNRIFVTSSGEPSLWGNLIGLVLTLVIMSPFLWAMIVRSVNRTKIKALLSEYEHSQAIVFPVLLLRFFLAFLFVGLVAGRYIHMAIGFILVIVAFAIFFVAFSRQTRNFYRRIESHFVTNFTQRQAQYSFKIPKSMEQNFLMEQITVSAYSSLAGVSLAQSHIRNDYNINVVSIERAGKVYDLPNKDMIIMPQDKLTVIGDEEQISRIKAALQTEPDILVHDHSLNELNTYRLEINADSTLLNHDIRSAGLQNRYRAMVIAIERGNDYMLNPKPDTVFTQGDVVWFVSPQDISLDDFENDKPASTPHTAASPAVDQA